MRRYPLLPSPLRRLDRRLRFAATVLAAAALAALVMPPPADRPPTQLVRWTADGHDWLLVADRQRNRISAYDARDGRPLGTIDHADGLADVDRLVLEGRWLVVLGDAGPQVVRLPALQPQPLAAVSH
jgi:hypothetical protein